MNQYKNIQNKRFNQWITLAFVLWDIQYSSFNFELYLNIYNIIILTKCLILYDLQLLTYSKQRFYNQLLLSLSEYITDYIQLKKKRSYTPLARLWNKRCVYDKAIHFINNTWISLSFSMHKVKFSSTVKFNYSPITHIITCSAYAKPVTSHVSE